MKRWIRGPICYISAQIRQRNKEKKKRKNRKEKERRKIKKKERERGSFMLSFCIAFLCVSCILVLKKGEKEKK